MSLSLLLIRRFRFLMIGGFACSLVFVLISFLFPLQYRADTQVLILPRAQYGVDPTNADKSAQRAVESLSTVVSTDEFRSLVVGVLPGELQGVFNKSTAKKTRTYWNKTVVASPVFGTNFLNISAYSTDKQAALQVVSAATQALLERGQEYTSTPIVPRIINQPIVSDYPARPNILVNAVFGFLLGVCLAVFLLVRREHRG
jgi:capsular polysaccharide biosynthesis protein